MGWLKRITLTLLFAAALLPLAGGAVEPKQPFLPFFTIKGTVYAPNDQGAPLPAGGREVRFLRAASPDNFIKTTTLADGTYAFNIYDLNYYYSEPITFNAEDYKLIVPATADSQLTGELAFALSPAAGFMTKDLQLAAVGANPASIVISPADSITLKPGSLAQFTAKAFDASGQELVGYNSFAWAVSGGQLKILPDSNNSEVIYTAGSEKGDFALIVTAGKVEKYIKIIISDDQPLFTKIVVTPASATIKPNAQLALTAAAQDQFGNIMADITDFNWSAVEGTLTVGIGPTNSFSAIEEKTYLVTVSRTKDDGSLVSKQAEIKVTAADPVFTELSVDPRDVNINLNQLQIFKTVPYDQFKHVYTGPLTYSWSASGGQVSSSGDQAIFSAGAAGNYKLTVSADGKSVTANISVSALPSEIASITAIPDSITLAPGAAQTFTASALDKNGLPVENFTGFTWTAEGGQLDSATGKQVTFTAGAAKGDYFLTLAAGELKKFIKITISDQAPVLTSIAILPAEAMTLTTSQPYTMTAVAKDQFGNTMPALTNFNWGPAGGGALDKDSGQTVTYTAGQVTGDFLVTVSQTGLVKQVKIKISDSPQEFKAIKITPPSVTLLKGQKQPFIATPLDQFGNPLLTTAGITYAWTASGGALGTNTGIEVLYTAGDQNGNFQIDVIGNFNGVAPHQSATIVIGDQPPYLKNIGVTPQLASIELKGQVLFTATTYDQNNNVMFNIPISWTVDVAPSPGTINSGGLFSAGLTSGTFANAIKASSGNVDGWASVMIGKNPPEGTYLLNLSKVNHDIKIAWTSETPPEIYYLTGNGSGQYKNLSTAWGDKIDYENLPTGFSKPADYAAVKYLWHQGQVGGSTSIPEVYYKAIDPNLAATEKPVKLAQAWAVGKIDLTFNQGNTFFNYPFESYQTINEIFGNSGFASGSRIMKHNYSGANFEFAEFDKTKGLWTTGTKPTLGAGNIFFNPSDQAKVTLLGYVRNDNTILAIKPGSNLIGAPYPKKLVLSLFGNSPLKGDRVLIHNRPKGNFDVIEYQGSAWQTNSDYPDFGLEAGKSYWYYRTPSSAADNAFNWTVPKIGSDE